jgi:Domain of unknown function (DUF4440)
MRSKFLIAALTLGFSISTFAQSAEEAAVLKVEEELRVAELANDIAALERILHPNFYTVNQNGNARNKKQVIDLWKSFRVQAIVKDNLRVQITDGTAVVTGEMTETNPTGVDRMLFTRVYRQEKNRWLLLASMQARRSAPSEARAMVPVTTRGGLTAEEIRVGGSCVVVVSRPGAGDLAVTPCSVR